MHRIVEKDQATGLQTTYSESEDCYEVRGQKQRINVRECSQVLMSFGGHFLHILSLEEIHEAQQGIVMGSLSGMFGNRIDERLL